MEMHQGSVLSPFVIDVVTELARESLLTELLYADGFVFISEIIYGLSNDFRKW